MIIYLCSLNQLSFSTAVGEPVEHRKTKNILRDGVAELLACDTPPARDTRPARPTTSFRAARWLRSLAQRRPSGTSRRPSKRVPSMEVCLRGRGAATAIAAPESPIPLLGACPLLQIISDSFTQLPVLRLGVVLIVR